MRKMFTILLTFSLGLVAAQEDEPERYGIDGEEVPTGLAVGDEAPDIQLKDQHGEIFQLQEALEEGPVVLTFYRGNWCPYCTRFLAEMSAFADEIDEKGATIVAISPETEVQTSVTGEETHENIHLLSDFNGENMEAYDVVYKVTDDYQERLDKDLDLNLTEHNQQAVARLPVAATYVIDQNGEIAYRYFDLDYKNRAPINEILKALDNI